jgi:hypothetical protein
LIARLEKLFVDVAAFNVYFKDHAATGLQLFAKKSIVYAKPADVRYREFRDKYACFEQQLSQQHMASYLGIPRESLSRSGMIRERLRIFLALRQEVYEFAQNYWASMVAGQPFTFISLNYLSPNI